MKRHTWFKNKNYHMTYEITGDHNEIIFVHVEIFNFSKKIFKDLKQKWEDFKLKLFSLGHEFVFTYTKDTRIVEMIGGGKTEADIDGWKVVSWELD